MNLIGGERGSDGEEGEDGLAAENPQTVAGLCWGNDWLNGFAPVVSAAC